MPWYVVGFVHKIGLILLRGLLTLFLVVLSGCDKSIEDLEHQRSIWIKEKPDSYAYTVQVSGWRDSEFLSPKRVTVDADEGVSAVYLQSTRLHEAGDPAETGSYWTVESIFDELVQAKRSNAWVRARFDDQFGFVERSFIEYEAESTGWDVEIRDFEISDVKKDQ